MKTIVLLSDGTGNSAAKLFRTNVWRIYESLDLSGDDQIAFYDNGVGTSSFKPLAILGGAFGWGLKRNVRTLYAFLCRNYVPGDRVVAFGFSRGAFTIRVLIDMISDEGVIVGRDGAELTNLTAWVYRKYRGKHNTTGGLVQPLRLIRDRVLGVFDWLRRAKTFPSKDVEIVRITIPFVGLWDTVSAYGLPIQEMTRGWDQWVWPLSMDNCKLSSIVTKACHALSLDDARQTFHPLLWDETGQAASDTIDNERITQVWFAGVHSNVGGGYPNDSLSFVPLQWIAAEAEKQGVSFQAAAKADWDRKTNLRGPLYDSRSGLGGYYRYGPRRMSQIVSDAKIRIRPPKIHESVVQRILSGVDEYAPIVIPATYSVVTADGSILSPSSLPELPSQAHDRAHMQERCWNLVWLRRWVYFATVGVSVLLAVSPFMWKSGGGRLDGEVAVLSVVIGWIGAFMPGFAMRWVTHYQQFPVRLLVGGAALAVLLSVGAAIEQAITDRMRVLWRGSFGAPPARSPELPALSRVLLAIRTHPAYVMMIRLFNRAIFPTAFGVSVLLTLLWVSAATINRAAFTVAVGTGRVCADATPLPTAKQEWSVQLPPPVALCHATGIPIEAGHRYRVAIDLSHAGWHDKSIPVDDADGFSRTDPVFIAALPWRRNLGVRWFVPIVRVGASGWEEHALSKRPIEFVAQRSGQLFFFVNDAVAMWPYWSLLYDNNEKGTSATLTIESIDAQPAGEF